MFHLSTEFCENRLSSFCVILLTNKQSKNVTSLAKAVIHHQAEVHFTVLW